MSIYINEKIIKFIYLLVVYLMILSVTHTKKVDNVRIM